MKGADQCPRCASRKTGDLDQQVTPFYSRTIRVCGNCGTAWEPADPAKMLDKGDRYSCFVDPCDNCAFRKGSSEQRDPDQWRETLGKLGFLAGRFYCHKGVPLDPEGENGFAYPQDRNGKYVERKMRLCRGYLNYAGAKMDREMQQVLANAPAAKRRGR